MREAKAGWSQIEITPPLGLPMGGRGSRFTPGAEVLDPLLAQALVLEDSTGERLLWISMDMIGMSYHATSELRLELVAATGIAFDAIVINASHTHSGPMTGFEGYATLESKPEAMQAYESSLIPRTVRMVHEAMDRLVPAKVRVHRGQSDIGINRRRRDESGHFGMGPDPDGMYNRELWVLDIAAGDDRCIVFSYGCHPVLVYGYAYDGISADWPGVCRNRLQEVLGPRVQAQFIQGLAGNVRPRQVADLQQGVFRKPTSAEDHVEAGGKLAEDVLSALGEEGELLALDLAAVADFARVPRDQSKVLPLAHWHALATSDDELSRNVGAYWVERLRSGPPLVRVVPWAIGRMRLAQGHQIVWMAGEPLAEWLGHLRRWLEDENLVAWGYCQDGRCYMPTDEVIPEGGYEVIPSNTYNKSGPAPFAPGINAVVRQALLDLRWRG